MTLSGAADPTADATGGKADSPELPVLTTTESAVRTITLNRPGAFNAFNFALKDALLSAIADAADDPAVRAVVITGTGRAFCAGQDLKEHLAMVLANDPRVGETVQGFYNPLATAIATMRKPVIAAVNGSAAGAGAALAYVCDLRIAARSASFRTSFAGVALSADSGLSATLPRLVGSGRAKRMLLLDEKMTAEEALAIGMVDQLVEDGELASTAAALAARLAAGPTAAYGWIKASVHHAATADLASTLAFEDSAQAACFAGSDHREAIMAFVEKRAPKFTGS